MCVYINLIRGLYDRARQSCKAKKDKMIKDKMIKNLLIPHTKAQRHGEKKEQKPLWV